MEWWDDQQCLHNFRMCKATFLELCAWLAPTLQRQDTHLQPAIPLQKRVTIALWKLATPEIYQSVGNHFGVGKSTIGALLMQMVRAINSLLLCRVVSLEDLDATIAGFTAWGFPNCRGTIDGTHIPIWALDHQVAQFISRKGYFSVVLQVLVDHWGQFTNVYVQWSCRLCCVLHNLVESKGEAFLPGWGGRHQL